MHPTITQKALDVAEDAIPRLCRIPDPIATVWFDDQSLNTSSSEVAVSTRSDQTKSVSASADSIASRAVSGAAPKRTVSKRSSIQ